MSGTVAAVSRTCQYLTLNNDAGYYRYDFTSDPSAMNLRLTSEQEQLRGEVRAFLQEHCPAPAEIPHDLDARMAFLRDWQRRCYEAGYVGRAWPREFGGGGPAPLRPMRV